MSEPKLVSVVIPTLNRPELTKQAYLSAINQTYEPIEVVIVDNGSSDLNQQRMKELNLDYLVCNTPGAGAARKFGLNKSSGEFVLFLDSDDLLEATAISRLIEAMAADLDGVFGLITNIVESNIHVINAEKNFSSPLASNTLLHRTVFDKYGEFDDDNYSWPRWLIRSEELGIQLGKVDALVAKRIVHGGNLSLSENSIDFYIDEIWRKVRRRREDIS